MFLYHYTTLRIVCLQNRVREAGKSGQEIRLTDSVHWDNLYDVNCSLPVVCECIHGNIDW